MIAEPILVSPSTKRLLPNVPMPVKVDTPVTRRSLDVVAAETPSVTTVAIPEISKFLPLTSSYTISPVTFKSPSTYTSLAKVPIPVKVDTPVTRRSLDVVAAETPSVAKVVIPVSYTHLTLPTKA